MQKTVSRRSRSGLMHLVVVTEYGAFVACTRWLYRPTIGTWWHHLHRLFPERFVDTDRVAAALVRKVFGDIARKRYSVTALSEADFFGEHVVVVKFTDELKESFFTKRHWVRFSGNAVTRYERALLKVLEVLNYPPAGPVAETPTSTAAPQAAALQTLRASS